MKTLIIAIVALTCSSTFARDIDVTLRFENPVRDCKSYVPKKGDHESVFSNVSVLKIRQHEENNEEFADILMGVAFGKCVNGQWLRYTGTPLIVKGVIQRGLFNKKKFALKATFDVRDVVNDGRAEQYSPSVSLGLNVSLTKIKELLKEAKKVEVVAQYELLGGNGAIYARYTFQESTTGEIYVSMDTI